MTTSATPVIKAGDRTASAFDRFTRMVEWFMAILALAFVPALIPENNSTTPTITATAVTVNWIITVSRSGVPAIAQDAARRSTFDWCGS